MNDTMTTPALPTQDSAVGTPDALLAPSDTFVHRHIGPSEAEQQEMLRLLGYGSLDGLIDATVPPAIRLKRELKLGPERGEHELLLELQGIAKKNKVFRSFIGQGYYGTITPPVIQRNILENPGWYTQYTPYQAEISQGRLEALLNFQTMVTDLTGMDIANASLLDEGTAAAEAMHMCHAIAPEKPSFLAAQDCHPQTLGVLQTHAEPMGIRLEIVDPATVQFAHDGVCGLLLQYPSTDGCVRDYH